MTERIFESAFHKRYVGGEGVVEETPLLCMRRGVENVASSVEEVVAHFRRYVGVKPEEMSDQEIIEHLNLVV